jgi:hypothetical protein
LCLQKLRKGQLLPDVGPVSDVGFDGWSSRDKFAAVLETASMNEADLAEYCRKRRLYPAQISAWRAAFAQANDWDICMRRLDATFLRST